MRGFSGNSLKLNSLFLPKKQFLTSSKLYNSFSLSAFHYQIGSQFKFHPPSYFTRDELFDFFADLLHECRTLRHIYQAHTHILAPGLWSSGFLASKLISAYARFGALSHARNVFETVHLRRTGNYLLWNTIMRATLGDGQCMQVVRFYIRMRKDGIFGDGLTFPLVIRACTLIGNARVCRNIHGHVLGTGYQSNIQVENSLIYMYSKMGQMSTASKLFDRMTVRNQVSWNTMVSGFANNSQSDGALEMFKRMEVEGWEPNVITWTSLLSSFSRCGDHERVMKFFCMMRSRGIEANAEIIAVILSVCGNVSAYRNGGLLHGYVIKGGFEDYLFVKNSLVSMYGKHGNPNSAHRLFLESEGQSLVTWNALISSYAECGLGDKAFAVFSELDKLKCIKPNVISWSAVICGFGLMDKTDETLDLFRQMQLSGVFANSVTICSVLRVCAKSTALCMGKEIHGHVIKASMDSNVLVGNSLLNMYMKCGSLTIGHLVFERINGIDLISWNSLIDGYGIHGYGAQALRTFNEMIEARVTPDAITFVAILSACGHAGLVDEGRMLFRQMTKDFNIGAQMEHYACIVDILGRGGFLQEASEIVKGMPMVPNEWVWGALLNSCRMHRDSDIAEKIAFEIFQLHPETAGSYMLMSNIYASNGRWEDSARTRISARTTGLKKLPGQSWVEVNKSFHVFQAGDAVEKGLESVYDILKMLTFKSDIELYTPDERSMLPNFEG
uniref:Pentatricopeptide repeat-containing protein At1g17630 n=1 Tax=Kalanchoe fedtschenkoi TaxID=63787 RepID=A0A7N0T2Y0_KALFE